MRGVSSLPSRSQSFDKTRVTWWRAVAGPMQRRSVRSLPGMMELKLPVTGRIDLRVATGSTGFIATMMTFIADAGDQSRKAAAGSTPRLPCG